MRLKLPPNRQKTCASIFCKLREKCTSSMKLVQAQKNMHRVPKISLVNEVTVS